MSFKKSDKKNKKSTHGNRFGLPMSPPGVVPMGTGSTDSAVPESTRAKLLELFSQIEQQFELIHSENIACEPLD